VEFVEEDSKVSIKATYTCSEKQTIKEYFLPRISQKTTTSTIYQYHKNGGQGVIAYVLDTGIYLQHSEFPANRVFRGPSFVDGQQEDGHGHGIFCWNIRLQG